MFTSFLNIHSPTLKLNVPVSNIDLAINSPEIGLNVPVSNINLVINSPTISSSFTGILDTLNKVSDCKYDFSPYKRLTGTYTGNKIYIERLSDNAKDTITTSDYDSNGDINSSEIATWAGGGDVVLLDCYSETQSGKKAYQSDNTKAPKIVVSGVWQSNGPVFDGGDDTMVVDNYSGLNILEPPLTIYSNFKNVDTTSSYVVSKGTSYRVRSISIIQGFLDGTGVIFISNSAKNHKLIFTWASKNANQVFLKNEDNVSIQTYASSLGADSSNIYISNNFDGNIKSILIFNTNEYSNYSALVAAGI